MTAVSGASVAADGGLSDLAGESPRRAIGTSFAASAVIQLVNMSTGVLLARTLGPTDRGLLAGVLLWPVVLGTSGSLGIMEASTYFAARGHVAKGRLIGSGLLLAFVQSLVFCAIGAIIIPLALADRSAAIRFDALVYLGFIPLNIVTTQLAGVLNGLHRYTWFQSLRLLVVAFTATFLLVLAVGGALTVRTAVFSYLAAGVITLVASGLMLMRIEAVEIRFDRSVARMLIGYGIRSHASTVSSQLNINLDQLIISIFLAPRELGLYVVAVSLTSVTLLVGNSIGYAALPIVARQPHGPERTRMVRRLVNLTLLASALASVPLIVIAPELTSLFFGDRYGGSVASGRILLVAAVVLSTNRAVESILRGIGRPLDAGIAEMVALVATLGGLAALLPLLGIEGAAVASLAAYLVSGGWMLSRLTRALGGGLRELLVPDRADTAWVVDGPRRLRVMVQRRRSRRNGRSTTR